MPGNGMGVSEHGDLLLQNKGDGTFVDVSQKAGLYPDGRKTKYSNKEATSFDYDNDGLLDIFISNGDTVPLVPNIFYHNEGNGRFKDIAAQIGLDNSRLAGIYPGDYDNDGDMDLFISVAGSDYWATDPNDQGVDQLWRNEGNGVFVDVAEEAGVQKNINSFMGFSFDYDNDGDLDLYLRQLPSSDALGYDVLYRNNGNGTFSNVAQQAGILQIEGYASGTDYGDYDNDGWLDICATYQPVGRTFLPVVLYHNNRDGTFADVSEQFNIASYINSDSGPDFVDYDSDGDLDIFLAITNALYRNNGTGNHWLQMKLVGSKSNRDAVGARARVIAGELSMIREIFSFSHSNHSDRLPLHFGLGVNQKADLIEIRWPGGIVQTFTDIPADQRITIDESEGILTVIRQVIPDSGQPDGGTAIRIQGESFLPGSKVLFSGVEAVNVRVETSTLITAVTPSGVKGVVDVEVINPDGRRGLLRNGFRYSTIQVTKFTPSSGPTAGGTQIQIEGSGFQQGVVVRIGNNQLAVPFVTSVFIKGELPAGASGKVDISIINPDGEVVVLRQAFTYIPPPTIDRFNPSIGPLMSSAKIKIFGSGFIRTPSVHIGGIVSQKVVLTGSDWLEVDMPSIPTIGPQDVTVINPDGQRATLAGGITIIAPPKIKSIKPANGSIEGGTEITIAGDSTIKINDKPFPSNLKEVVKVLIGGIECTEVTVKSDYIVTAIAPPNTPGPKDVTIIDSVGQDDTLKNAFTYNTAPQVTRVIPNNGRLAGGTPIAIHGSGFIPGAEVVIRTRDGYSVLAKSIDVLSSTMITALTPSIKPGICDITVINPDGQRMTFPDGFTYNPMPTISRINPNFGSSSGGAKIVIEGTGFLQGVRVMIGERYATAQLKDDMTIEAVTPPNRRGKWDVRVINSDTQEAVVREGFVSAGVLVYNYPNPFRASQGTTFRCVTNAEVDSITVRIFNLAGVPIGIAHQEGSKEAKWYNSEVHVGMYVYDMEVKLSDGGIKHYKGIMEVCR